MIDHALAIPLDDLGPVHSDLLVVLGQVYDQLVSPAKAVAQRGQLPVKEKASLVNDHHSLAQLFHVREVVRGQNDRHVTLAVDVPDELADALFGDHVQADGRFVQKEQVRIVE
jgi:hypothetical protein